jgi:ABC-type phosphate transport system substrate-binding protein
MGRLFAILLAAVPALVTTAMLDAAEPLVVIVHPDSGVQRMSAEEVANIFLGSEKRLANGLVVLPVELVVPEDLRSTFYKLVAHTSLAQVRSYWAQRFFSGQAQPPRQAQSAEEVIDIVSANKGAIGFIGKGSMKGRVHAVLILGVEGGK